MKINKESVKFAKQADILDEIESNGTGNSFLTSKRTFESSNCKAYKSISERNRKNK